MADCGAPPARTVMGVPFAPGRTVVIFSGLHSRREIDDVARLGHVERVLHPAKGAALVPCPTPPGTTNHSLACAAALVENRIAATSRHSPVYSFNSHHARATVIRMRRSRLGLDHDGHRR